mmetsp:Transcript_33745/g.94972  ORF Transcript_33745/g.94972 Transcript_33745/m.94972 type:complete len:217 (-) Transcript_33745:978-1628(-)
MTHGEAPRGDAEDGLDVLPVLHLTIHRRDEGGLVRAHRHAVEGREHNILHERHAGFLGGERGWIRNVHALALVDAELLRKAHLVKVKLQHLVGVVHAELLVRVPRLKVLETEDVKNTNVTYPLLRTDTVVHALHEPVEERAVQLFRHRVPGGAGLRDGQVALDVAGRSGRGATREDSLHVVRVNAHQQRRVVEGLLAHDLQAHLVLPGCEAHVTQV